VAQHEQSAELRLCFEIHNEFSVIPKFYANDLDSSGRSSLGWDPWLYKGTSSLLIKLMFCQSQAIKITFLPSPLC